MFFANAEQFHEQVLSEINDCPTPVSWFVIAAEPMTSIDVTAADMLVDLDNQLGKAGIQLIFAELKDPVKDKLKRYELSTRFDDSRFYPTLGEFVEGVSEGEWRFLG